MKRRFSEEKSGDEAKIKNEIAEKLVDIRYGFANVCDNYSKLKQLAEKNGDMKKAHYYNDMRLKIFDISIDLENARDL